MLQRVANACGVSWSLETGLRLPKAAANETSVAKRPRRGTNARMIEEILQAAAPRAVRPAEIRKALQDKGVAMAFTTIRHALGQLEARHAAEQVTDRETWRHRSSRGRPLPLRHDRSR